MTFHSLAMGGAETFFTHLVAALQPHFEVTCYIPALACSDPLMRARLPATTRVHSITAFTPFTYRIFYKLTLLLQRRFPAFDPEQALHTRQLLALHQRYQFDVVNAHLMPAARQVCTAFASLPLPITKSDHGDTQYFDPKTDAPIFQRLDALICPAAINAERARSLPLRPACQIVTIPYGHPPQPALSPALPPFSGVTFGMVARGVADKGWLEAIAAARLLHANSPTTPIRLILVGDGPCLQSLRQEVTEPWITFVGQQADPQPWIRSFDVGLLPTCLPEESLPNTIIEYLAYGKPVIATAIGGIPQMLASAGKLIPLTTAGRADVSQLAAAMEDLLDPDARSALATSAPAAFAPFSMSKCVAAYESLFTRLLRPPSLS
jgi:glycosyltransferase involved in cell wall biosynthesis